MLTRLLSPLRTAAVIGVVAAPDGLEAQQGTRTDTARTLPTVAVSTTRTATSALTTPMALTAIGPQELRSMSGYGLDEALSKVPGVIAQSRFGTSDVRIVIRGFGARGAGDRSNAGTSRGIRVLVDGIPETEPDGRTAFDQIDLATASAVEVIRSNASSVWGNASGGVINVLTSSWNPNPMIEAQPVYGSFGLERYALRMSAPMGSSSNMYVNYTNTTWEGWRDHSDSRRLLVNAGFVTKPGASTKLGFYASGANHLQHIPGPLTLAQVEADPEQANATYATRDERRYNRIVRFGATVDHEINDKFGISGMAFVSPKYLQRSERNTFRDFTRYHLGGNFLARWTAAFSPKVNSRLTVGVDDQFQDGAILFYNLVNGQRGPTLADNKSEGAQTFGAFVQDELLVGDRLTLLAGARSERVSYYNKNFINPAINGSKDFTKTTPKLGASWKLGNARAIYANFAGGVEVPAGNEVDPGPNQGTVAMNPLLEPIVSNTFEVGMKSGYERVGPLTLSGDIAFYNTNVKNDLQPYNQGRFYMSAGKTRRRGLEIGVNAETNAGIFGGAALAFSDNKYLKYSVDSSNFIVGGGTGVFDGNEVIGVPSTIGEVEIGTEVPGFRALRFKVGVEFAGKYFADDANLVEVPSHSIVNLTAELRRPILRAGNYGLRGFISVHNVADKAYIGSAFLNPDYNGGGEAMAFEPGMPRAVTVSFTLGRVTR
ncbi:MAG TPA: TonB-dependent receptor [Gemmatimonadaceae bacterium]|nr:TonB-dependent receptor [Gemmatimonadaceae bacterium]